MRALDVTTFGYAENLQAKGGRVEYVFFRHRNNNTAAEKQLQQRKHCKKHYFLVVGLEWWCLKKRIAKEIENYELTQVNTLLERFYVEIKNKHG